MNLYFLAISVVTLINACESSQKDELTKYTLQERHILPEVISETSGIIKHKGLIWTFNDSGGKPSVYGFNLSTDSIEQTITLSNAINKDWEDIAQDEKYFYIGDFGNNQGTRDSLSIYKISKALIPESGDASVIAEKITFTYPGYEPITIPTSWSAFDCEAFITLKDSLYLFTKDWTEGKTTIFSLPTKPGNYLAKKLQTLNPEGLVTGADYNDNKLVILGYSSFVPFVQQYTVKDLKSISDKDGVRYDFNDLATYQTEGICFDGNDVLISSEKTRAPAQIIRLKFN